jgi:hypothetical protein
MTPKASLRPIGTEFWHAFPLSPNDQGLQKRFLYRIVAHSKTVAGWSEELEVVKMETRPCVGIRMVQLSDRAEPDYVFGEWQERERI